MDSMNGSLTIATVPPYSMMSLITFSSTCRLWVVLQAGGSGVFMSDHPFLAGVMNLAISSFMIVSQRLAQESPLR